MQLTNYTYQPYTLITAPKIHTDLLWDLSILFVGISVVYFITIFVFKKRISKASKKTQKLRLQISPVVSEFIFLEDDASKDEKSSYLNLKVEIRERIKDKFYRKTITETLLDLRKDVSGAAQKRLFGLYKDLGLHKESYKKLKSWRWEAISQGIRELTQMQVAESYGFVTRFINDKRPTIRKQAEIAVVTLKEEGINYFLDTTKHRISEWQQLKLMEVLANQEDFVPPSFKMWLTSKNKYVVLFALRLIKHYDQNDASTSITELVKHRNKRIKREAIDCIKTFHITDALGTLKTVFWKSTVDTKIAILDAIGNLGSEKELEFLKLIDNKEASFSVRSKALAAINMISPEAVLPTEGILDVTDVQIPKDIKEKKKEVMENHNTLDEYEEEPFAQTDFEEVGTETIEPNETEIASVPDSREDSHSIPSDANPEQEDVTEERSPIDHDTHNIPMKKTDLPKNAIQSNENAEVTKPEEHSPLQEQAGPQDLRKVDAPTFSIDFLPIIIQNEDKVPLPNVTEPLLDHYQFDVCFEEVKVKDTIQEKSIEKNDIIRFDVTEEDMHFIPIVVQKTPETELTEGDTSQTDIASQVGELGLIEVSFERVNTNVEKEIIAHKDPREMTVLYEEVVISPMVKTAPDNASKNDAIEVSELVVLYQEIKVPLSEKKEPIDIETGKEVYSLEVVYEEIKGIDLGVALISEAEETVDLESMEVVYKELGEALVSEDDATDKEIEEQELPNWLLEEIASPVSSSSDREPIQMKGPEWDAKIPKMTRDINYLLRFLPEPKIYENDLNNTMQLLDDIEFFGDEREIPLLEELMQKEKKEETQSRIKDMMARFQGNNKSTDKDKATRTAEPVVEDTPYSIFEEFFRHCDTESKLILLGEIVPVGDEKEVYFLEQLLDDPEPSIRAKASNALAELKERLGPDSQRTLVKNKVSKVPPVHEETPVEYEQLLDEMEIAPAKESDIFTIGFELLEEHLTSEESKEEDEDEDEEAGGNAKDQSLSKPFKNIRKKRPDDDG